jgi:hypothetical protein
LALFGTLAPCESLLYSADDRILDRLVSQQRLMRRHGFQTKL